MKIIEYFFDDMERVVDANIVKVSFRKLWRETHPQGTPANLDEYLKDVIARTFYYGYYHAFDEFRKSYSESHDGQPPYVIPFVHRRWAKGAAVSDAEHEDASKRIEVYRQWVLDNVLHADDEQETLIVLPISNVEPNYRDELSPSPEEQSALDQLFLSPILGAPDISVPIGEVPFMSKITQREEFLPVLLNVVGAPGKDIGLLHAIQEVLKSSERPMSVLTGKRMFS